LGRLRRRPLASARLAANDTTTNGVQETLLDRTEGPGDAVLARERGEVLERAIVALPDSLRAAFVLRDIEGVSTKEAAAALGITESAVKVRLHRARLALRASLTEDPPRTVRPLPEPVERRLLEQVCSTTTTSIPEGT
jgi:RNA polymerase sigma-70 factor (ECF subfamily)